MLACFSPRSGADGEAPLTPSGRKRLVGGAILGAAPPAVPGGRVRAGARASNETPTPEEEDEVFTKLTPLTNSLPMRMRGAVVELLLGGGANGFAFVEGGAMSAVVSTGGAAYDSVMVWLHADVEEGSKCVDTVAQEVLDAYLASSEAGLEAELMAEMRRFLREDVNSTFALLISDRQQNRVLLARDATGAEPLFWAHDNDRSLLVSSQLDLVGKGGKAFPGGEIYICSAEDAVGRREAISEQMHEKEKAAGDFWGGRPPSKRPRRASAVEEQAEGSNAGICRVTSTDNLKRVPSLHEIS